jgi:FkbM family methyltransferase
MLAPLFKRGLRFARRAAAKIKPPEASCHFHRELTRADILDPRHHLWNWRTARNTSLASRWEGVNFVQRLVRTAQQSFPIDAEHMMCRILARYWLIFRMGDGLLTDRLMADGLWETSVTEVIAHEVQPGMRVVDVGANVGYFSLLMADLVGDKGQVYVVEPTPTLHACLRRSLCLNYYDNRFTLVTHPLSDKDDQEVEFFIPNGDTKNARIDLSNNCGQDGQRVVLKTRTLDSVIPRGEKIGMIKVDVEGAELQAWNGMQRVIKDNPDVTIILEYNAGRPYDPKELLERICRLGFRLEHIDELWGVQPTSMAQLLTERVGLDWMLYLKRR